MVTCSNVVKTFAARGGRVVGLDGLNLEVRTGEFVAVQGPSGSGKSTLLLLLGGMLRPTSGTVSVLGSDLYSGSGAQRAQFRASTVGFVFQLFHLVPYLNVRENIAVGWNGPSAETAARVDALMDELGLSSRARELPGTLSAGERQRVALARALVKNPPLILADEPTGNLDPANATIVFRRLSSYHRAGGTVIVVTHGGDASPYADRMLRLESGTLVPPLKTTTTL